MSLGVLGSVVLAAGDEVEISLEQSASNTLVFTQLATAVLLAQPVSNTLNLMQSASCFVIHTATASNTLALSQSAYRVQEGSASNTLVFDQDATFLKFKLVSASNAISFAHTVTTLGVYNRSIFQAFNPTNVATANINRLVSASNAFTIVGTATGVATKSAVNTLVFSQDAEAFISKKADNFLELTQSVDLNIVVNRAAYSSFEPLGKATTGPNTFRRSLTSFFNVFDTAVGYAVKSGESVLNLTQTLTGYAAKKAANLFEVVDHASYNAVFNVTGIPSMCKLNLTQTVTVTLVKYVSASNVISFEQLATKQLVKFAEAENTLNLSQDLIPGERIYADAENTLDLDQTASAFRVLSHSASSIFAPIQTLTRTVTFNRSASNTLTFTNDHQKLVNIGGTTYITVPNAIAVVVDCKVILQGLNNTIVLPCPEFDDSEAYGGSLVILRSKKGGKWIYKKGTDKAKLNYTFIIERSKVNELKEFVRIYNSVPFYLENHKGERWYVTFKTNPFVFDEQAAWGNCGKFSVNLEFEGVRLF